MTWWRDVVGYFFEDPLRIMSLVGGSGGVAFWYDRYKNRSRLKINIIDLDRLKPVNGDKLCLKVEVENLGTISNSLGNTIQLSGITPKCVPSSTKKRHVYEYIINNTDRNLPPNKPIIFEAHANWNDSMYFLWFIKVYFEATRGRGKKVYLRSFSKKELSCIQYHYERVVKYGIFSKLNIDAS